LTITSVTIPAGALIVVVASEVTSASAGTCADGVNTPYAVATSGAMSGAAGFGTVFYFANAGAVSSGTITYTKQTSGRACSISAFYVTGVATSTPLDTAVTATSAVNSATPTVTGGTPTQSGNLTIGACAYSNAAAKTLTNTGSFVTPFANNTGQSTASCGGGHLNVQGSLATTFNPTLSGASDNITMVVGFKPANLTLVGWWNVTKWAASTSYVCGNLVRQNAIPNLNAERVFVCMASTSGTGQSAATEPSWTTTAQCTRGAKFTDNTVTWIEATGVAALNGDLSTNTPTWTTVKNTAVTQGQVIQNVAGTLILIASVAGTAGNGAEPSWAAFTNAGATTVDNGVTWVTLGASFSAWAAPHARLANSYTSTWGQAGNTFFVADNHAEFQVGVLTLNPPTSSTAMNIVYCVDHTVAVPPTTTATTATITSANTGNFVLSNAGNSYVYYFGISFFTAGLALMCFADNTNIIFNSCKLAQTGSANNNILIGNSAISTYMRLINTTLKFANASATLACRAGVFVWENTLNALDSTGTTQTTLFSGSGANGSSRTMLTGVDLSLLGSGKTIVAAPTGSDKFTFVDCKVGASVTKAASPTKSLGAVIDFIRCDSAATNYFDERYVFQGTQTEETTIVRTGGATDGTTPISWKIASTANSKWVAPFESQPITIWNDSTSAITTLTFYGTTTGGGVPNNDDIWIEVEYLGSSLTPQGSFVTTTKANNLAASTTTNNSSDGSTWGGGGAGNGFKIVVPSFTPGQKGPLNITIKVAKASSTYYIDPRPSISGVTVSKSEILAPGVYANELQSGTSGMLFIPDLAGT
jgi:hypothetical protein